MVYFSVKVMHAKVIQKDLDFHFRLQPRQSYTFFFFFILGKYFA